MIRITAKRDGFRRCGVVHPSTPTDHPAGRFSPAELKILNAEPMLTVEEIADEPAASRKGKKKDESE